MEQTDTTALDTARVVTRTGVSRASAQRRRLFQRHLIAFLAAVLGSLVLDYMVVAPPGLQWAWWVITPWTLVFAIHFVGLKGRGYSIGELLTPPRTEVSEEDYPFPLDYEIVRARQLRDGIERAANSVAQSHGKPAARAVDAADALLAKLESVVANARASGSEERIEQTVPEARAAVEALDELHEALIAVEVLEESVDVLPVEEVEDCEEALEKLQE